MLQKYLSDAVNNISQWLTDDTFKEYRAALEKLIKLSQTDDEIANELFDSFWRIIPFGTGGRRWRVGIGPNRMNPYIIALTAQGHVDYLLEKNSK